jgi:transglutaminase-like putative cysteine protease
VNPPAPSPAKVGLAGFGFLVAAFAAIALVPEGEISADSVKQQLLPRTVAVTYRVHVSGLPRDARTLAVWIPLPRETRVQHVENVRVETGLPYRILRDPAYGNRYLYVEAGDVLPESLGVMMEYVIRRDGYEVRGPADKDGDFESTASLTRFLQPDLLVPTDGEIAERSANVLSGADGGNLDKARLLYTDILRTMKYDKSGAGWGRGDALYACEVGRGNCTDFHSLFIGMARAAGIPARFVIGFPLPPGKSQGDITGYHCWAEFYDEGLGWVPIDASEAWKRPEQREFFFGGLDANRMEFTVGRDIPLVPEDKAGGAVLNYSIYPCVVVNGVVFEGAVTSLRFRDVAG